LIAHSFTITSENLRARVRRNDGWKKKKKKKKKKRITKREREREREKERERESRRVSATGGTGGIQ